MEIGAKICKYVQESQAGLEIDNGSTILTVCKRRCRRWCHMVSNSKVLGGYHHTTDHRRPLPHHTK
jgi:hypothetical protein